MDSKSVYALAITTGSLKPIFKIQIKIGVIKICKAIKTEENNIKKQLYYQ